MKSISLVVNRLASIFCKEFITLAPEFELKGKTIFTTPKIAIKNEKSYLSFCNIYTNGNQKYCSDD